MIGMKFWLRKWLEHHAAHLICGEHVERSAEDWHISQNLGSNVSTQSSTNLCSARDLCSVCSPVSNNVQHPMLLNCYDLLISLFFDCMFFLEICRFRGLFIAACCRMLSFWSPLSPLPLVASRVEDHRSEEKKHSTYVQIISVNLVKYSKVM